MNPCPQAGRESAWRLGRRISRLARQERHLSFTLPARRLSKSSSTTSPSSTSSTANLARSELFEAKIASPSSRAVPKLLGTPYKFERHGEAGHEISELMPHLAGVADELCHGARHAHRPVQSCSGSNVSCIRAHRASAGRAWAVGSPTASAARMPTCPASLCSSPAAKCRAPARAPGAADFCPPCTRACNAAVQRRARAVCRESRRVITQPVRRRSLDAHARPEPNATG